VQPTARINTSSEANALLICSRPGQLPRHRNSTSEPRGVGNHRSISRRTVLRRTPWDQRDGPQRSRREAANAGRLVHRGG
jgi:hypothetical protein